MSTQAGECLFKETEDWNKLSRGPCVEIDMFHDLVWQNTKDIGDWTPSQDLILAEHATSSGQADDTFWNTGS